MLCECIVRENEKCERKTSVGNDLEKVFMLYVYPVQRKTVCGS